MQFTLLGIGWTLAVATLSATAIIFFRQRDNTRKDLLTEHRRNRRAAKTDGLPHLLSSVARGVNRAHYAAERGRDLSEVLRDLIDQQSQLVFFGSMTISTAINPYLADVHEEVGEWIDGLQDARSRGEEAVKAFAEGTEAQVATIWVDCLAGVRVVDHWVETEGLMQDPSVWPLRGSQKPNTSEEESS
jgi:hypothetical protein